MSPKLKRLIIFSIIILFIVIHLGIIYFNKNLNKNNIEQLENKTSYEVILKPNIYFLNNKLDSNNYYIASSINNINIYFNYYLKSKTKENISYDLTATIQSYADNGTKIVWTKDFNLKKINNLNQDIVNIKETYNLDYQYYVNYVKSFQEYYNIKTENYLYVKLNIKINDQINPYVLLTIPINENVIEITMKEDNTLLKDNNQNIYFNSIIIFIFTIIIIVLLLNKKDNEKTILKKYQDIIITIQSEPNIKSNNIIYLTNLKDLVNIALNNNLIIFNYQNTYYSIIDNIYYIYHLKDMKD